MDFKYFGPIRAEINPQTRRVRLTCKRGPQGSQVLPSMMTKVAAWAVDSVAPLQDEGYKIDTSKIEQYLARDC